MVLFFTCKDKLYMAVSWNGITLVELSHPLTLTENRTIVCVADKLWERRLPNIIVQ